MINRVFIALELPPSLQNTIIKQTAPLRQQIGEEQIRWVPAENIHLTLKFLGDIPEAHFDFLKQSLSQIVKASSPFDLQISGLGSFPSSKLPRILWIDIHAPAAFNMLQKNIEESMIRLGYKKEERPFSPHLTLGRVRQSTTHAEAMKIHETIRAIQVGNIGAARVNSVHLFKSDLTPAGSEYTKLFSANFNQ